MAFFQDLTTLLKQKWLQFFQENRAWITIQMQLESVYTPDGGRRPSSYLILGVVNALEPQLGQLMLPFSQLNPDADALVDVLELNFDPALVLQNLADAQADMITTALAEVAADELSQSLSEEIVLVETEDGSIMVLGDEAPDELGNMSLDEIAAAMELAEPNEVPENFSAAQPQESVADPNVAPDDVSSDVWADESSPAEERQSAHDEEISRLFPNS